MNKRYQVFISSTYTDLKDERRAAIETVMDLDCIPAGMELFPAADEDQFEYIKRVIDDCDYYLLIIGARYGSPTTSGISYTEQEYDYAVSKGLKVIALIHESPDDIAVAKSDIDPVLRARLESFRKKASNGRLVSNWKDVHDLPRLASKGLSNAMRMFPAIGWVRANRVANEDTLVEINELRKRNEGLQLKLDELSGEPNVLVDNLAGLEESIMAHGRYEARGNHGNWEVKATWAQIFGYVAPFLTTLPADYEVKKVLGDALWKLTGISGYNAYMDNQLFQTISVQLQALGLVNLETSETKSGETRLSWSRTPEGERLMFQLRTVRSVKLPPIPSVG